MIESLEEETYSTIELLKQEDSKKTRSSATKLLVKISEAIKSGHERLKQSLALHKPSPQAYLELYHGIMQADRLFELEKCLKEALGVKEKTQERIEAVKLRYRKLPICMSGDRYRTPKRKLSPKQLELFS
jgi:hypothetical protein